jgi:hypothetical protein
MKHNAKSLITGDGQPVNEGAEGMPPAPGSGQPRRPMPPGQRRDPRAMGGPGGPPEEEGMLTRQERVAMKDLVLLDLLNMTGSDPFFVALVNMAVKGTDPDPAQIRHFMDEAGKFAKSMTPQVVELMNKLAAAPR